VSKSLRRLRVVVSGRVQGVWFRGSMVEQARALGVAGWVENRPDGTVEAVVEGPDDAVERILKWCHHGPSGARVDDVTTSEEPPAGITGFDVTHGPSR